jgi:hypothetical protein
MGRGTFNRHNLTEVEGARGAVYRVIVDFFRHLRNAVAESARSSVTPYRDKHVIPLGLRTEPLY